MVDYEEESWLWGKHCSGADGTEPAGREEEGRVGWVRHNPTGPFSGSFVMQNTKSHLRGALFTQLMLQRLSISLSYLT